MSSTGSYTPESGRPTSNSNLLAIRYGRWKLHLNTGALFDLQSDIGETKDIAPHHQNLIADLKQASAKFLAVLRDNTRPIATQPL